MLLGRRWLLSSGESVADFCPAGITQVQWEWFLIPSFFIKVLNFIKCIDASFLLET